MPAGYWGRGVWGVDLWGSAYGPSGRWKSDWVFWYQTGRTFQRDLTGMVVEAHWTSDSHTLGDGTLRGDIQPGNCQIRLNDPEHVLAGIDKHGAIQPPGAGAADRLELERPLLEESIQCAPGERTMGPTTLQRKTDLRHSSLSFDGRQCSAR